MVNTPGDQYEQEADRVAEQVMRMPEPVPATTHEATAAIPALQRKCSCGGVCDKCSEEQEEPLRVQRSGGSPVGPTEAPPIVHETLRSPGQPLDVATRAFMESRFGQDFSHVRVHTGAAAAASARAVGALAYTLGTDVVFNAGTYAPQTSEGRSLLAHELTHVVQQRAVAGGAARVVRRAPLCANLPKVTMPTKFEFATDDYLNTIREATSAIGGFDADLSLQTPDVGSSVALVQRVLLNTVCDEIDRDALVQELDERSYGPQTVRAVRRFQQGHSDASGHALRRDGQVGPLTLSAMDEVLNLPSARLARPPKRHGACYGEAKDGPGVTDKSVNPVTGERTWVLSNFDVDKHFIKEEHRAFLQDIVVPEIKKLDPNDHFNLSILGEASTTDTFGHNWALSHRRADCASQALNEAATEDGFNLQDKVKVNSPGWVGELPGDIEQVMKGIPADIGIENPTKRQVTIHIGPDSSEGCNNKVKQRATDKFVATIVCDSSDTVRIVIQTADSHYPIYRQFVWSPLWSPKGCIFLPGEPPDFAPHHEGVIAGTALRLATRDADNYYAPSDFEGPTDFHANGQYGYLEHDDKKAMLFVIDLLGTWKPDSCGKMPQSAKGLLEPDGPVQCGFPEIPQSHCQLEPPDACSEDHKMAEAKRFNGVMYGGTHSIKEILPDEVKPFIDAAAGGLAVKFGTRDPDVNPPLTRWFAYIGGGFNSGGSGLDQLEYAKAPDQDADEPSQLAISNPDSYLFSRSDFTDYFSKLTIHGHSNKVELQADGAGTFTFFNKRCNRGGERSYRGVLKSVSPVYCPAEIEPADVKEQDCEKKDECDDDTRLAGHKKFTIKVGRATLASLPGIGRQLAKKYGCHVAAAFVNVQSEDGPEEKRIHREFVLLLHESGCTFTASQGEVSFSAVFERQLATEKPDEILSDSDFVGVARLNADGELSIVSGAKWPISFKLPGAFDPSCKVTRGGWGATLPVSEVECGAASEPINDGTTAATHTDDCNNYKARRPWVLDYYTGELRTDKYQQILDVLKMGQFLIPRELYYQYWSEVKTVVPDAMFVGWAPNPYGGSPIRAVAFATIRIAATHLDGSMDVEFLTDLCAFDEWENVVMLDPQNCIEGTGRKGQIYRVAPLPKRKPGP
jgi:peptidoglycan hydrolase-like protein with peptidoglycan-binding domain